MIWNSVPNRTGRQKCSETRTPPTRFISIPVGDRFVVGRVGRADRPTRRCSANDDPWTFVARDVPVASPEAGWRILCWTQCRCCTCFPWPTLPRMVLETQDTVWSKSGSWMVTSDRRLPRCLPPGPGTNRPRALSHRDAHSVGDPSGCGLICRAASGTWCHPQFPSLDVGQAERSPQVSRAITCFSRNSETRTRTDCVAGRTRLSIFAPHGVEHPSQFSQRRPGPRDRQQCVRQPKPSTVPATLFAWWRDTGRRPTGTLWKAVAAPSPRCSRDEHAPRSAGRVKVGPGLTHTPPCDVETDPDMISVADSWTCATAEEEEDDATENNAEEHEQAFSSGT